MKNTVYWILSALMVLLTVTLVGSTDLRDFITKNLLKSDQRKVLSVITINSQANDFKIFKIKKGKKLIIEVYSKNKKELFDLGIANNGTVFLGGKSTQLASVDLDNDGLEEIIVPTLNSKFKSELYILKYNIEAKRFSMSNSVPYLNLNY